MVSLLYMTTTNAKREIPLKMIHSLRITPLITQKILEGLIDCKGEFFYGNVLRSLSFFPFFSFLSFLLGFHYACPILLHKVKYLPYLHSYDWLGWIHMITFVNGYGHALIYFVNGELSRYENRDVSEERRAKLREVEIRVLQYQDELEQGIRSVKQGYSIHRQVAHYRHKMMRKVSASSFWLLDI